MLKGLAIENYALIESLRVEWDEHLNIWRPAQKLSLTLRTPRHKAAVT